MTLDKQYETDKNLKKRINLHEKYSINKLGFGNWIDQQYAFQQGMQILELGCGNGSVWPETIKHLPAGCKLILSDFSQGMLDAAKARVGEHDNLSYQQIDIMDIPYEDCTMDAVVANMMLYHIPDINRALFQVRRVLKNSGVFYCATYGENSIMSWLSNVFSDYSIDIRMNTSFTIQNGAEMLKTYFSNIQLLRYPDAFEITNTDDLVDYVLSMTSMANLAKLPRETIYEALERQKKDGMIHVPKEYGMFICRTEEKKE